VFFTLADALDINVEQCKNADIFRRHKVACRTFVDHDSTGHYWPNPVPHDALKVLLKDVRQTDLGHY
jgi:hypothetical protein